MVYVLVLLPSFPFEWHGLILTIKRLTAIVCNLPRKSALVGHLASKSKNPTTHWGHAKDVYVGTMLQKLSKCEVKAARNGHFSNLLPLRFYVKSNFGKFKLSKNVIFGKFRDSELWILANLGLESCSNLPKSKFRTSKIGKNDILNHLNLPKFDFT